MAEGVFVAGRAVIRLAAEGLAGQGRRLACWLPVSLALGVACYFALPEEPSGGLCLLAGALCLAGLGLLAVARGRESVREEVAAGQVLAMAAGGVLVSAALGFLLACGQARRQPPMPLLPMESVWLEGRLSSLAPLASQHEGKASRWRLGIAGARFESPWWDGMAPLQRELLLVLQPRPGRMVLPEGLAVGGRVRLRALLRPPPPALWPGGHDGQRMAWFAGRAGTGVVLSPPQSLGPGVESRNSLLDGGQAWLLRLRAAVAGTVMQALPGRRGAVAAAVLCGETGLVSPATRRDYAASGLAHLLAVAGLHLGFVMGMAFVLVRRALSLSQYLSARWPCREVALLVSLLAGGGYVVLTGCHLPGLRAFGMAAMASLAFLLGRRALSLRSLALVALALEVASPVMVLDVSFQMSVAAVMALVAGYEPLRGVLSRLAGHGAGTAEGSRGHRLLWREIVWRRGAVLLVTLVMTSLLAGLATLPLSMAYFGAFQPWFVLANLLAVPLMGVWVMPAGLLALLLMPLGLSALPLRVMGWGIGVIDGLAHQVATAPLASWPVPSFPAWSVGLYLVGLAWLCLWQGRARLAGGGLVVAALLSVWLVPRPVLVFAGQGPVLAVRQPGGMRLVSGRLGNPLARQDLQRALGWQGRGVGVPVCKGTVCRLRLRAGAVILWQAGIAVRPVAEGEALCRDVVLEVRAGYQRPLCPAARQMGPGDARREGSWAVYDEGRAGVRLLSDRMVQGHRLWNGPAGFRGVPPLPLAPAE